MIGRSDLEALQKALIEIEGSFPIGALGIMEEGPDDLLVQIVDHGVLPTGDTTVPASAGLTLAIAFRAVGQLPLGRQASTKMFPRIHQHGIRDLRVQNYAVIYVNLDA